MPRQLLSVLLLLTACAGTAPMEPLRQDEPGAAAEFAAMKRQGSADVAASLRAARLAMRAMPHYATASDAFADRGVASDATSTVNAPKWQSLGPGNIGGRTRALVIDPADPQTIYAGGVSGGLWKTTDGGARWQPIGDELANIAVNALVMSPFDRNVLYAGTGEGYFREEVRGTALPLRGNGIFVTRDAGSTWTRLESTSGEDFHWVNDLALSTHDARRMYAATRTGVWRSRDGGAAWERVLATTVKGGCLDLAARAGSDGDFLFASCGTLDQATVYRAVDADGSGADAWTPVLSEPLMGRTSLAIAPSNPDIVYALSATNEPGDRNQGMLAVWRSDEAGAPGTWRAQVTNDSTTDRVGPFLLTNLYSVTKLVCEGTRVEPPVQMGWYCNTIAVDPVDPERLFAAGVDLFRSDDGGRTWGVASYWWAGPDDGAPYLHADQHAIVFDPRYDGSSNQSLLLGNDGGVYRTANALAPTVHGLDAICTSNYASLAYEPLNHGYGVTQFYNGAVFPDGRRFIGGTQDNGTIIGSVAAGPDAWKPVVGGDGGYVAVDPNFPEIVFGSVQYGNVVRSIDGGETFMFFRAGLADNFLFIAPFALDPSKKSTLWLGGTRMWRTSNGSRWFQLSAPLPAPASAVAVDARNAERVLAGTKAGHIARTDSASTMTSQIQWPSVRPREGFVSSLAFDPHESSVAWATYAGFGGAHVWRSRDGGATWEPRDGSGNGTLPDIPVHSIAPDPTHPGRVYLGTDLGVFVSLDDGAHWAVENSGFGPVVTETVLVAPGALGPAVYAFTHGRGAWRVELVTPGPRRRSVRR